MTGPSDPKAAAPEPRQRVCWREGSRVGKGSPLPPSEAAAMLAVYARMFPARAYWLEEA